MKYPQDMSKGHQEFVADEARSAYLIELHLKERSSKPADPPAGYANLTTAISSREHIDWERLDGLKVQCVKPGTGALHGVLERYSACAANIPSGWWITGADEVYTFALNKAWNNKDGWTLYVEGEIPLRRKTADQLKAGTYFLGEAPSGEPDLVYVGGCSEASKAIFYAPAMLKSGTPASEWVVLEEYGPFQKPEGK